MIGLILNGYWDICLLKESPENTPYSIIRVFLSGLVLALIKVVEWNFSYFMASSDFSSTLFIATCLILSYFFYTYIVLFIKRLTSRLVQTLTSLYCISIIMHVLVAPLILITPYLSQIHSNNPFLLFLGVLYLFFSLGLAVWQFVITAHIYKHALNTTAIQSVLVAFGLLATNILTVSSLQ